MHFANCLKYLRTDRGMTQKELAEAIGVSTITIQNWERGIKLPNISMIPPLSDLFQVSSDFLLGINIDFGEIPFLSDDEMKLLFHYRKLDDFGQKLAINVTEMIDLTSFQNRKTNVTPFCKKIPLYDSPAAAGYGNDIDDSRYEMIEAKYKDADFAIRISGDSMSPYIKDGDIVFVKKINIINDGDIGIFSFNGSMYCKQAFIDKGGRVNLVSLNEKFKSANVHVSADSSDTLTVLGEVIIDKKIPFPAYLFQS